MTAHDGLRLAATPTFAFMALLTGAFGHGSMAMCSSGPLALSGMVPMYLLMSVFHAAPWLTLMANWRDRARQP
jgi:hypothetical protein